MDKFDSNFKFEDTYKSLSSVKLVEPNAVECAGIYYPLNKQSSRLLNSNLGMRSHQFSNQLYNHDIILWRELRDKKDKTADVKEYKDLNYLMIINNMVVSVVSNNTTLVSFMKIIDELVKDVSRNYFYSYKDDEFQFLSINKDNKTGYLIRYNLSFNWITINSVYYDNKDSIVIYISSETICDKQIENDLEIILDKDALELSTNTVQFNYEEFLRKSKNMKISFEELFYYLKCDFKLKLKYTRIDPFEFLADKDYSSEINNFISDVLTYIYDTENYKYLNASYLKKSIKFSKYNFYEYYRILSDLYVNNEISVNSLIALVTHVSKNRTNFSQISD